MDFTRCFFATVQGTLNCGIQSSWPFCTALVGLKKKTIQALFIRNYIFAFRLNRAREERNANKNIFLHVYKSNTIRFNIHTHTRTRLICRVKLLWTRVVECTECTLCTRRVGYLRKRLEQVANTDFHSTRRLSTTVTQRVARFKFADLYVCVLIHRVKSCFVRYEPITVRGRSGMQRCNGRLTLFGRKAVIGFGLPVLTIIQRNVGRKQAKSEQTRLAFRVDVNWVWTPLNYLFVPLRFPRHPGIVCVIRPVIT